MPILEQVNKHKVQNPAFNKNEFSAAAITAKTPGPPLPLTGSLRRDILSSTSGYSIPASLANAAKIVAESTSQTPHGDQPNVAATAVRKYSTGEDTQASLVNLDGRSVGNSSQYWMIADQSHPGVSPFAPAGYKVWRNVADYGATGNGVTDDTAAINAAIADGGRCGMNCPSSTIFPAVVYFPPGTYLVSSPIIQLYNTQFLGDPFSYPTILAASSFVGLGVITSDVYTGGNTEYYVNTNNFYRNIKNFKIDIRNTNPTAYVCAIHWQVAQATSLENIEFYMVYNTDVPSNTQQGIYMENGSGGFLANLTFVGGNFGAYFGNQQFTTSHLVFVQANIGLQVHYDWAWTMQDFIFESCGVAALQITDGDANESSLLLVDAIIANTPTGILTALEGTNSTSLLLQNVGFFNVQTAVHDVIANKTLLAGGNQVLMNGWGIGSITNPAGVTSFAAGRNVSVPARPAALLGTAYTNMKPNWFTRRRPTYYNVPDSKVLNVRALGAKGDGKTDDSAVLNAILANASSTSSIVFFPYGVYLVKDTVHIPPNSRVIGQVWSQIMGSGPNFANEKSPRPVVQVCQQGCPNTVIEIQDLLFTVSGPTAGAVLVEWNAKEAVKGNVGLWDTHFRVGGAVGSNLQAANCPKLTGKTNLNCKAASALLHMTPGSHGYLENVWAWTADHDIDNSNQTQIDIYTGRGMLIESSHAWLWGTASEHNVMYQYQVNNATNVFMGMIQTETPYWQPAPPAAHPFTPGLFADDPSFAACTTPACALAWATRIVNSQNVFVLGAGLYSFFSAYNQTCLATENCQDRGVQLQSSSNTWLFNLNTKAMVEMVSPFDKTPLLAANFQNDGFVASLMSYLGSS